MRRFLASVTPEISAFLSPVNRPELLSATNRNIDQPKMNQIKRVTKFQAFQQQKTNQKIEGFYLDRTTNISSILLIRTLGQPHLKS